MEFRDAVKRLEEHGFQLMRQRGRCRKFERLVGGNRITVTISGKEGVEPPYSSLNSIMR